MLSVCYDTFWSDFSGTFLPNAVLFMLHAIQQVQNLTTDSQRTCIIDKFGWDSAFSNVPNWGSAFIL